MNDKIIIAYMDAKTKKIYLPEKYTKKQDTKKKIIMNRTCYETSKEELDKIKDKKIIITKVYLNSNKIKILVAKYNEELFVNYDSLSIFNLKNDNKKKIKIDNTIYTEITKYELRDLKKEAQDKQIQLVTTIKNIYPKNKEQ